RRGSEERSVLFDVGPSAEVWLENARRLSVRLASIEAVCLSHWHSDHSGGLPGVVVAISRSRLDEGLPPPIVDLHPDRPDQRGIMTPAGTLVLLDPGADVPRVNSRLQCATFSLPECATCWGTVSASGHSTRGGKEGAYSHGPECDQVPEAARTGQHPHRRPRGM